MEDFSATLGSVDFKVSRFDQACVIYLAGQDQKHLFYQNSNFNVRQHKTAALGISNN